MFEKFEIQGVHTNVDSKLQSYVTKKIGGLDRYLAQHSKSSAHCEVQLKGANTKNHKNFICEVALHLPHDTIVVTEKALNMFTAVDVAETKLKQQLMKYKDQHASGKLHRRLFNRLRQPAML